MGIVSRMRGSMYHILNHHFEEIYRYSTQLNWEHKYYQSTHYEYLCSLIPLNQGTL
jgi:hypothetical protein